MAKARTSDFLDEAHRCSSACLTDSHGFLRPAKRTLIRDNETVKKSLLLRSRNLGEELVRREGIFDSKRFLSLVWTNGEAAKNEAFGERIMVLATFDVYNGPIPFGTSVWKPSAARYRVTNVIVVDATRAEGLRATKQKDRDHTRTVSTAAKLP